MKKISAAVIVWVFISILALKTQAQTNMPWQTKEIMSFRVTVTYSKTTNIVFPYAIVSVDIGSPDVLAQKAKGVDNILQIKAAKEYFQQTNISIVTADGNFTSFIVDYSAQPTVLNLFMAPESGINPVVISSERMNQDKIEQYAMAAADAKVRFREIKDKSNKMLLCLNGIFVHEDLMFFRFKIANYSAINYDIDQLRLYIRDQKRARRTATQEIEIIPLAAYNHISKIPGNTHSTIVFAVEKFTIPDKKYLAVQLIERNGGRHVKLRIKNRNIIDAIPLD